MTTTSPAPTGVDARAERELAHGNGVWVTAAPFRAHARDLVLTEHLPWRVVAGLAGVPDRTVRTLVVGRGGRLRPRLTERDARALLAIDRARVAAARATVVPGATTARAIRELLGLGWSVPQVAAMLDITARRTRALLAGASATRLLEAYASAACRAHGIDLADRDRDAADDLLAESARALRAPRAA